MAAVPRDAHANVDTSDEESGEELEEGDVDDTEILADLPDDTEVWYFSPLFAPNVPRHD